MGDQNARHARANDGDVKTTIGRNLLQTPSRRTRVMRQVEFAADQAFRDAVIATDGKLDRSL